MVNPPDLDYWLPKPALRVAHQRDSVAGPDQVWQAAQELRLRDTRRLGRLIRWRIPGVPPNASYRELFHHPPFTVLAEDERSLLTGVVGRIWTLRRDYPTLDDADAFRAWSRAGTARALFANWVQDGSSGALLQAEVRVQAFGLQGRVGLASVRPLVRGFHNLIGSDALDGAVRAAEDR